MRLIGPGLSCTLALLVVLTPCVTAVDRRYYIAAVNINWDYTTNGNTRDGPTYKKAVYREYDPEFKQAKTPSSSMGLLGPTIRGQEGDTIFVTFRNMVDHPCSIHAHGIAYRKQSEGSLYFDNTSEFEKGDDFIRPGQEHTYSWEVTREVAPQAADPPCVTYMYFSHVDIVKDFNTGLIGTMLICKKGSLDDSGNQVHFNQELTLLFGVFDENRSWYSRGGTPLEENVKYTLNGFINGSVPDLSVCAYSKVTWNLLGMSSEAELFSVHFNGHVLQESGHKVSSVGIVSGIATSAVMKPVYPGRWLVSSYVSKHLEAGMHGYFTVNQCDDFTAPKRRLTIQQSRDSREWTYYIAVEETVWDYAPELPEKVDGDFRSTYLKQSANRIGKQYKKAVFTQYKNGSFIERAEQKQRKKELGILGPVIRAQIRDVVKIVFKNKASRPYSIYPHGLTIDKTAEGANYPEEGNHSHAVQPGETFTYVWPVLEEDEPLPGDSRCVTRMYHSAVNTPRDIASGLVGPLLICKSQSLNTRNVQVRSDKEQHAMFTVFDENKSWYLDENINTYCGFSKKVKKDDPEFYKSNVMHTINGYVYESGQTLGFCNGEIVTWHVSSVGDQDDIQTATFYGHTFVLNNREEDILSLYPMTGETISMDMANIGVWLLASLNTPETSKGLRIKFRDVECYREYFKENEYDDDDDDDEDDDDEDDDGKHDPNKQKKASFSVWEPVSEAELKKEGKKPTETPKQTVIDEDTEIYADLLNLRTFKNTGNNMSDAEELDLSFLDHDEGIVPEDLPPSITEEIQNGTHTKVINSRDVPTDEAELGIKFEKKSTSKGAQNERTSETAPIYNVTLESDAVITPNKSTIDTILATTTSFNISVPEDISSNLTSGDSHNTLVTATETVPLLPTQTGQKENVTEMQTGELSLGSTVDVGDGSDKLNDTFIYSVSSPNSPTNDTNVQEEFVLLDLKAQAEMNNEHLVEYISPSALPDNTVLLNITQNITDKEDMELNKTSPEDSGISLDHFQEMRNKSFAEDSITSTALPNNTIPEELGNPTENITDNKDTEFTQTNVNAESLTETVPKLYSTEEDSYSSLANLQEIRDEHFVEDNFTSTALPNNAILEVLENPTENITTHVQELNETSVNLEMLDRENSRTEEFESTSMVLNFLKLILSASGKLFVRESSEHNSSQNIPFIDLGPYHDNAQSEMKGSQLNKPLKSVDEFSSENLEDTSISNGMFNVSSTESFQNGTRPTSSDLAATDGNRSITDMLKPSSISSEDTSVTEESREEVVIYLKNTNISEAILTSSLDPHGANWSYEATHKPVPVPIPDHVNKYITDEQAAPPNSTKEEMKKKVVIQKVIPMKGFGMKTKKKKAYVPQPHNAISPRSFSPLSSGLQPRGTRPIHNVDEELLAKSIVIGLPRKNFNDYELYVHNHLDDFEFEDVKENSEEYEYVEYKDPYTKQADIQNVALEEVSKYLWQSTSNKARVYFIAAEEVNWDYAGYGHRRQDKTSQIERPTVFKKVLFREYLDSSFTTPYIRGEVDEHLGILGPVIKAEVDETIYIVFRNLASRPYSLHANGMSYGKNMEGLTYEDESPYWYKQDNEVQPNATFTYIWTVNAKVGPVKDESDCRVWPYYSGVNSDRDIHSGLIGPVLVCRKGTLNKSPVDTRDFMLLFMTFDENKSWYYESNRKVLEKTNNKAVMDPDFNNNIKFHAINGIVYSLKGLRMYANQLVKWHLINMGSPKDLHSVHFHGQTFLNKQYYDHRQGVFPLLPGSFATLEMWPSKPGLWLLESEIGISQQRGMQTLFLVLDKVCDHPLGLMSGTVKDSQITASDSYGYWVPSLARLHNTGKYNAWSTTNTGQWIQVDFQRPVVISKVATQGAKRFFTSHYVLNYTVSYSTDRKRWLFYKGDNKASRKVFEGNKEAHEVKENTFFPPIIGRFVRLYPSHSYNNPTIRMDFYGCELDGCSVPLGMESGHIQDQKITASSVASSWYTGSWQPWYARLNKQGTTNAWQAKKNDINPWLQIELKVDKKITGIVTQGAKTLKTEMFVTTYSLEYSKDGKTWTKYTDDEDYEEKTFKGNVDNNSHVKNYIFPPIFSRFIRIIPKTWQSSITMRIELLGCDFE